MLLGLVSIIDALVKVGLLRKRAPWKRAIWWLIGSGVNDVQQWKMAIPDAEKSPE